jgi:hypothetical protein
MHRVKLVLAVFLLSIMLTACGGVSDKLYKPIDDAVNSEEFENALLIIDEAQAIPEGKDEPLAPIYDERASVLLHLDKGLIAHYAGKYGESADELTVGEEQIQEAKTKSVSQGVASYIVNDNTKDYAGEDYEDLYINIFNSLNFYHSGGDTDKARVSVMRAVEKIQLWQNEKPDDEGVSATDVVAFIVEAATTAGMGNLNVQLPDAEDMVVFKDSALARYIIALFLREEGNGNELLQLAYLNEAFASSPQIYSNPVPASLKIQYAKDSAGGVRPADGATAEEFNIPRGKARLNVIAFTGLSPIKKELDKPINISFFPTMGAVQQISGLIGEKLGISTGHLALPILEERPSNIDAVEIEVGGQTLRLELLEDIGNVINGVFKKSYNSVLVKTFGRTLIKYFAVEAAAQLAQSQGLSGFATATAVVAAIKTVDATENADIRSARYLPRKAFVGGITLDPGVYSVSVRFSNGEVKTIDDVKVEAGKLNLVESFNLK